MSSTAQRIREKLASLDIIKLEIIDETYKHKGHLETDNLETHLKVIIVAKKFQGLTKLERHRLVYNLVSEELQTNLHALSLIVLTPEEDK